MRRPWPLLAIALLVLLAVPGLAASHWPWRLLLAFLIPLAAARTWPTLTLAGFLAGAPLAMGGGSAMGQPWLEAATLGTAAGLLAYRYRHTETVQPVRPSLPRRAAWVFLSICGASFLVALVRVALEWRGQFPAFLTQAFWALPVMEQSSTEHLLRAGLILTGGVLWFLLLRRTLRCKAEIRLAWMAWLAGSMPVLVRGFWQWSSKGALSGAAVTSFMEDRNALGSYLVLTLFLAASMLRDRQIWVRRWAALATLLLTGLLFLSGSKIALLAALAGTGLAALPRLKHRPGVALICGALLLAGLLGLLLSSRRPPSEAHQIQRFVATADGAAAPQPDTGRGPPGLQTGEASLRTLRQVGSPRFLLFYAQQFRLQVWSAALAAALERPFLGVGPGLLFRELGRHYRLGGNGWRPPRENAHNYYLQLAAETGLAGLVAFLWLMGSVLRPALSRGAPEALRIKSLGLLAYLVTLLTGHPLVLISQVVLLWSFLALLAAQQPLPTRRSRNRSLWVVGLGPLLLFPALLTRPLPLPCAASLEPAGGRATPVTLDFAAGFYPPEPTPDGSRRWMGGVGQIRLCGTQASTRPFDLQLNLASFALPRNLMVRAAGRPLLETTINPWTSPCTLEGLEPDTLPLNLTFTVQPGPQEVDPILHNGDHRRVSLQFMGTPVLLEEQPAGDPSASRKDADGSGPGPP